MLEDNIIKEIPFLFKREDNVRRLLTLFNLEIFLETFFDRKELDEPKNLKI